MLDDLDECDGGIIQVQTGCSDACAVRAPDVSFCFIRNK